MKIRNLHKTKGIAAKQEQRVLTYGTKPLRLAPIREQPINKEFPTKINTHPKNYPYETKKPIAQMDIPDSIIDYKYYGDLGTVR
jgi:hypothetical protein